jgi:hypothetical protein
MATDALAWTQAVAAVVQAGGAIVIYFVTRDSVRISKEMSQITADQLHLARIDRLADQKQRATILRGLAQSLETRVSALPECAEDSAFRQLPLWTLGEIESLHTSAGPVLAMAADAAGIAAVELTWIRDRLLDIRAVPISQGFDYARFFKEMDWREHRATALLKLRELIHYAGFVANLADDQAKRLRPPPSGAPEG